MKLLATLSHSVGGPVSAILAICQDAWPREKALQPSSGTHMLHMQGYTGCPRLLLGWLPVWLTAPLELAHSQPAAQAQSPSEEVAPCCTSVEGSRGRLAPVPQQHSTSGPHKVQPSHQNVGPGAESQARQLPTQLPPSEPAPKQQRLPWKVAGSEGPAPLLQVG